jgi:hypothetical protein
MQRLQLMVLAWVAASAQLGCDEAGTVTLAGSLEGKIPIPVQVGEQTELWLLDPEEQTLGAWSSIPTREGFLPRFLYVRRDGEDVDRILSVLGRDGALGSRRIVHSLERTEDWREVGSFEANEGDFFAVLPTPDLAWVVPFGGEEDVQAHPVSGGQALDLGGRCARPRYAPELSRFLCFEPVRLIDVPSGEIRTLDLPDGIVDPERSGFTQQGILITYQDGSVAWADDEGTLVDAPTGLLPGDTILVPVSERGRFGRMEVLAVREDRIDRLTERGFQLEFLNAAPPVAPPFERYEPEFGWVIADDRNASYEFLRRNGQRLPLLDPLPQLPTPAVSAVVGSVRVNAERVLLHLVLNTDGIPPGASSTALPALFVYRRDGSSEWTVLPDQSFPIETIGRWTVVAGRDPSGQLQVWAFDDTSSELVEIRVDDGVDAQPLIVPVFVLGDNVR